MSELPYQRIISLVPSLTELLFYWGLDSNIIGRTRFCVHPKSKVNYVPIMGGTKNPRLNKIAAAHPDIIIANKEENRKEDIKILEKKFNVFLTDIKTIKDALSTLSQLGNELGVTGKAGLLVRQITDVLNNRPQKAPIRTAYLIWKNPWMSVGSDTYIHDVMTHWGLTNVFEDEQRYPSFDLERLKERKPELILLSSEPYPFKKKHIAPVIKQCPDSRIELINGEWFSWYGSRMLLSFKKMNKWRDLI